MLERLDIKNFALIDAATISFSRGFTCLTGETGAGKTILIGALSFLLGGRSDAAMIRRGAEIATVSGEFSFGPGDAAVSQWLSQHDIESDGGQITIRRTLRENGKTSAWIGAAAVSKGDLESFTSLLVDIHGQHEHQSLMRIGEHRKFLDSYAKITGEVAAFGRLYDALLEKRKSLDAMNVDENERNEKIEMLKFAIDEIEAAKLKSGEDDDLNAEEKRLSQYEKIYAAVDGICGAFDDALDAAKRLRSSFDHAAAFDETLRVLSERFDSAFFEIGDISDEIAAYRDRLVFDPQRLDEVQERLSEIFKLRKKYAPSGNVAAILKYAQDAQKSLSTLDADSESKGRLEAEIADLEKSIFKAATKISAERKSAAAEMARRIEAILAELGMKEAKFVVSMTKKGGDENVQKIGQYGFDDVEFLICANKGGTLQPLSKVASGGELSRVMLAIKTIFSDDDSVGTLIFDEIDTGIGGEVANSLAKHLSSLARNRQVLCITHLASIASKASAQIKIAKTSDETTTRTSAKIIEGDERVKEIARMLSGDSGNAISLAHAKSLLGGGESEGRSLF